MTKQLFTKFFKEYLELYPSTGSFLGHRNFDDRLENYLSQYLSEKWKKILITYKNRLNHIKYTNLSTLSFKWYIENEIRNLNNLWMIPLSPYENEITSLIFFNKHFYPLKTKIDIKNLTKRYKSMRKIILSCKSAMREGIKNKITLPQKLCKILLEDLAKFYNQKDYIIKLPRHLVSDDYKLVLIEYGITLHNLIEFIEKIYLPNCRKTLGICYIPSGDKTYKNLIISQTTIDNITPRSIFLYGMSEIERLKYEFIKNQKDLGYENLSYSQFYKTILDDPKYYAKTKDELFNYYYKKQQDIKETIIKKYFNKNLHYTYKIKSVPKDIESSSVAAFYYSGNYRRKKYNTKITHGTFFINIRDLKENPLYSAYVLSLHEGEPGHHYQFEYMIEKHIPEYNIFTFESNGFIEGWGLYCESLGDYTPIELFGKLSYEMLRAVRLVVDVGIHYYGWSWKKSLKFMMENIPMKQSELESELIRYISIPGQAVTYKIGERFFFKMRDDFLNAHAGTIKDFHNEILDNGIVPLSVLEKHLQNKFLF